LDLYYKAVRCLLRQQWTFRGGNRHSFKAVRDGLELGRPLHHGGPESTASSLHVRLAHPELAASSLHLWLGRCAGRQAGVRAHRSGALGGLCRLQRRVVGAAHPGLQVSTPSCARLSRSFRIPSFHGSPSTCGWRSCIQGVNRALSSYLFACGCRCRSRGPYWDRAAMPH
jgi:hypothetical protein